MKADTQDRLQLLIKQASRLQSNSVTRFLSEQPATLEVTMESGDPKPRYTRNFPNEEAIYAFTLTLRFFIRDGDGISFRSIVNNPPDDPDVTDEWKQRCKKIHTLLDTFLDEKPSQIVVVSGISPTRREILDVFVYGDLAHSNRDLSQIYEFWQTHEIVFAFLELEFINILRVISACVERIKDFTEQELGLSAINPITRTFSSIICQS